jgi:CDP-glucose 4,6-dehydratase
MHGHSAGRAATKFLVGLRRCPLESMVEPSFWKDRRVLVTGATGLIGSWLTEDLLSAGAIVTALVQDADPQSQLYRSGTVKKITTVTGDLEDLSTLERAIEGGQIDTVFHLGAQTIVGTGQLDPHLTFETNIRGTYNLLESCRRHPQLVKNILVASSDKAYGRSDDLPYTEETPLKGVYPYEVSKTCADLLAQSYAQAYGLPVVIVRCGNIFGGGDLNFSRIIPGTIRSLLLKEAPQVRCDGTFVRDYVFVKNVCQVYMGLAEVLQKKQLAGQAFNYSDGVPMTVLEVVEHISQAMGCGHLKPVILNESKGEIHSQYLSSDKLRRTVNLEHLVDFNTGLKETIGWYHDFLKS